MKKLEKDILLALYKKSNTNQKELSEVMKDSSEKVSESIQDLITKGYLDENMVLTDLAKNEFEMNRPRNAVILAAGFGMRMVPINTQVPKALIEVDDEPLIERIIKQLHEVGIREIFVVDGFMKEQLEYLIDEYGVKFVVNDEYALKNNLHSLCLVESHIYNTYIIPCDVWSKKNPFSEQELYSWYMVTDLVKSDCNIIVDNESELILKSSDVQMGNSVIGISYLLENEANIVRRRLIEYDQDKSYDNAFWESTLYEGDRMILPAKMVRSTDFVEINTYEQLRELDEGSNNLKSDAISIINEALNVKSMDVQ